MKADFVRMFSGHTIIICMKYFHFFADIGAVASAGMDRWPDIPVILGSRQMRKGVSWKADRVLPEGSVKERMPSLGDGRKRRLSIMLEAKDLETQDWCVS